MSTERSDNRGFMRRALIALLVGGLVSWGGFLHAQGELDEQVREVASSLRCPVCQNLSVADSTSDLAKEMRTLIREMLQEGKRPDEIRAYFISKYGDWILLSPRARGIGILIWVLPILGALGGLVGVGLLVRGWTRRPPQIPSERVEESLLSRVRAAVSTDAPAPELPPDDDDSPGANLQREQARLLESLQELEFDLRADKLSQADYEDLRRGYEARAAAVLKELEECPAEPHRVLEMPEGGASAPLPQGVGPQPVKLARSLRWAAAGAFVLLFGAVLGTLLAQSIRPRGEGSITGDPLTGSQPRPSGGSRVDVTPSLGSELQRMRTALEARVAANPKDLQALLGLGRIEFEGKEFRKAIELFKRALEIDRSHPEATSYMGLILLQAGHPDKALFAFDAALSRDPNFPQALWGKGMVLFEAKRDYAGAIKIWETLLGSDLAQEDRDHLSSMLVDARKRLAEQKE